MSDKWRETASELIAENARAIEELKKDSHESVPVIPADAMEKVVNGMKEELRLLRSRIWALEQEKSDA